MEVISDSTNITSPSKKSNVSLEFTKNGDLENRKIEEFTSSCPCISPTRKTATENHNHVNHTSSKIDGDKIIQEFQIDCTTPLLIQTT